MEIISKKGGFIKYFIDFMDFGIKRTVVLLYVFLRYVP